MAKKPTKQSAKMPAKPRIFVTQPIAESALKRLRAVASVKVYPDDSKIIPKTVAAGRGEARPTSCSACCTTASTAR